MVIGRAIHTVRRALERGRDLPARRNAEPHFGRTPQLPFLEEKEIGAEELTEVVDDAGDREVERVGGVRELDRHAVGPARHDAPGVFVAAIPPQRLSRRILRAKAVHVPRIVLDLVVAGTPRGQRDKERVFPGGGKVGGDMEFGSACGE